jgi:DNA-directed RNA polymerase specialized sigma24 family protein
MIDDEVDGATEAAAIWTGEEGWDPELGREAWCNNELALDGSGEELTEDETLIVEEGYEIIPPADPDLWLYRDRTSAILRRYLRLAVEVGRLPALLGREFFRTRVTSYHTQTFEDTVIFVHDVERCLGLLNDAEIELIVVIVMQEHAHYEIARMMRCTRRTIVRCYGDALDRLSEIFLDREILSRIPKKNPMVPEACQGGETSETRTNC